MAAFITILETPSAGLAGHIAASTKGYTGSTLARIADANINAGLGVVNGATPGQTSKAPSSSLQVRNDFLGVTIDPEFKNEIGAAADYLAGQQISILEEGYIWVQTEGTTVYGDDVYVRHTSDGASNTTLGKFLNNGDRGTIGQIFSPPAVIPAAIQVYSFTLSNGVVEETFTFTSDASPTQTEVGTGLQALIDASANFVATGTTSVTVTSGAGPVEFVGRIPDGFAVTSVAVGRAEKVVGAKFISTVATDPNGRTVAKIRLPAK